MKNIIVICIAILFASCSNSTTPEVVANNQHNLVQSGFVVGTFADGSELQRWNISNGAIGHTHYVYRITAKNSKTSPDTTTINYQVPAGKTTRTETIVLIDGVKYVPLIEKSGKPE